MALFAPNIYILNYLNTTGQLTEETKSKAIGYLTAGENCHKVVPQEQEFFHSLFLDCIWGYYRFCLTGNINS